MALPFEHLTVAEATERYDFTPDPEWGYLRTDWNSVLDQWGICEYPTIGYVQALGLYLAERAEEVAKAQARAPRLLEVAAGRGMLSHLLNKELQQLGSGAVIAATDGNARMGSFFIDPLPHVVEECHLDSLEKREPDIVIGAWLPADFTPAFRGAGGVVVGEYILIGRSQGPGIAHAEPSAWGRNPDGSPMTGWYYDLDKYSMTKFEDLQSLQLSYQSTTLDMHSSETFSFRRTES
jgi:hypothetical protein